MTATITAGTLRTLLAAAIPFTADSDGYPVLNAIRLEVGGGIACTSATDRYALGHVRKEATGSLNPVYLERDDAEGLVEWLDHYIAVGHSADLTELVLDDGDLFVNVAGHTWQVPSQNVGAWPDMGAILDSAPRGEAGAAPIGLGAKNLAHLLEAVDALGRSQEPMRWHVGAPKSAIRVEVGDFFVALLMPVAAKNRDGVTLADLPRIPYGLPVAVAVPS